MNYSHKLANNEFRNEEPKELMIKNRSLAAGLPLPIKNKVWLFGLLLWIVSIIIKLLAVLSDKSISSRDAIQLLAMTTFLLSWLYLKPSSNIDRNLFKK